LQLKENNIQSFLQKTKLRRKNPKTSRSGAVSKKKV